MPEAWRDPLGLFVRSWQQYGDMVKAKAGPYDYYIVVDADAARHILVENAKNYVKSPSYRGLRVVLGNGLITSENDFWRRQRKLAQPAFHRDRLAGFVASMVSDTRSMLDRWSASDAAEPFDIHYEMMRLTFRIVGHTLFSIDLDAESQALGPVVEAALRCANEEATAIVPTPVWVPTVGHLRLARVLRRLDALVYKIVSERRKIAGTAAEPSDLLSMLMSARDEETREQMTDKQLRDEILTLALAGHETTANTMTWTFDLLSRHPDVARRLREEVQHVLGGRAPALADLPQLPFTKAVIEESMRLYPPVWAVERQAVGEDVVAGYRLPRGAVLGVCTYALHRHPRHFPNPEGFDPDRFMAGAEPRHRYAYIPFGAGPRMCIGNAMAMMEAQVVLAMVVQEQVLELVAGQAAEPVANVTLRPKAGVMMRRRPVRPPNPAACP
jgi:cytochrome P450